MRERVLLQGMGLGAALALVMGAGASPLSVPIEPLPRGGRSEKPNKLKKYPRARKRDRKFEARVAATNAVTHPRHIHPRHKRPAVTVQSLKDWEANVALAASRYTGSLL